MSPLFRYHVRVAKGIGKDGTIEALNEKDALKKLQERGLFVIGKIWEARNSQRKLQNLQ